MSKDTSLKLIEELKKMCRSKTALSKTTLSGVVQKLEKEVISIAIEECNYCDGSGDCSECNGEGKCSHCYGTGEET